VSASIIVLVVAWKRQRQLAYLLLPIVLGVIVATVYGRFHYVLDTIAGLALGIMITALYLGLESQTKKPASP
jgi:membrane-associated phospholipid phosphatase